jgi:hypothetical protein
MQTLFDVQLKQKTLDSIYFNGPPAEQLCGEVQVVI